MIRPPTPRNQAVQAFTLRCPVSGEALDVNSKSESAVDELGVRSISKRTGLTCLFVLQKPMNGARFTGPPASEGALPLEGHQ